MAFHCRGSLLLNLTFFNVINRIKRKTILSAGGGEGEVGGHQGEGGHHITQNQRRCK